MKILEQQALPLALGATAFPGGSSSDPGTRDRREETSTREPSRVASQPKLPLGGVARSSAPARAGRSRAHLPARPGRRDHDWRIDESTRRAGRVGLAAARAALAALAAVDASRESEAASEADAA